MLVIADLNSGFNYMRAYIQNWCTPLFQILDPTLSDPESTVGHNSNSKCISDS